MTTTPDGWEMRVTQRCPNIRRHSPGPMMTEGCPCHPTIPMPCPDCYAVETLSRRVPWSALGWEPQPGATGPIPERTETQ